MKPGVVCAGPWPTVVGKAIRSGQCGPDDGTWDLEDGDAMTTTKKPTTRKRPTKGKADLTVVGSGNRNNAGRARNGAGKEEAKRLEAAARDARAFGMWLDGKTLRQIGDHFGWSAVSSVHDAITRHVRRTPDAEVEAVRLGELTRLNRIAAGLMDQLDRRSLAPADWAKLASAYVRVSARIAAIVGVDAPRRNELTGADGGPIRVMSDEDAMAWMLAAKNIIDRRLQAVPD